MPFSCRLIIYRFCCCVIETSPLRRLIHDGGRAPPVLPHLEWPEHSNSLTTNHDATTFTPLLHLAWFVFIPFATCKKGLLDVLRMLTWTTFCYYHCYFWGIWIFQDDRSVQSRCAERDESVVVVVCLRSSRIRLLRVAQTAASRVCRAPFHHDGNVHNKLFFLFHNDLKL